MPVMQRVVKPTTHKGKKVLLKKEPKAVEPPKETLCIKGSTASQYVTDAMKDLYTLKKSHASLLARKTYTPAKDPENKGKNKVTFGYQMLPFEDPTAIENLCKINTASLFMFASNNKKRPHNLVMGRMFDHHMLDMVEFGVENFKAMKEFKVDKISAECKPMLLFNGDLFNHQYARIKNLLVDMFQQEIIPNVRLQGLEHVMSFTANENKIYLRSFKVCLKKSGTRIPRIELVEMGPRMDLAIRRTQYASDDLFKQACKKPRELKVKKKKNVTTNKLGTKLATIHVGEQKINSIQTRKMKGLKKTISERKAERKRKASAADDNAKRMKMTENADS